MSLPPTFVTATSHCFVSTINQLTAQAFWFRRLRAYVHVGYPRTKIMKNILLLLILTPTLAIAKVDLVKVDKYESKMFLMNGDKVIKECHIALGANPKSHKQQEGDKRTSEALILSIIKKILKTQSEAYHQMVLL